MMEDEMPLPTNEELARLPRETLLKLWVLTQQFKRRLMAEGCMPVSAIDDLARAVPDKLMSEIVNDQRRGVAAPSGLAGPSEPKEPKVRGSGWQAPTPLEPPSGIKYVDQIADHFAQLDREQMVADAIDRVRKIRGRGDGDVE
jgi:hypothetical protein